MDTRIYWFVAVFSYIVQTKCLAHLQSLAQDHEKPDSEHQGLAVFLAFIYFVPWLLLAPCLRLLSYFDSRPASPVLRAMDNEMLPTMASLRKNDLFSRFSYVIKLSTLALLVLVAVFTYMSSLSLTPAFDVSLIQNTSIFEITTLLYGVCGLARRKNVFRNYCIMMVALVGILLVSYTKATCDLLAGKYSVNQKTGELNDPFLFDRLKSALLCGLGALTLGPVAVLWNRWFDYSDRTTFSHQCVHLTLIASLCMAGLLPFLPNALSSLAKGPTGRAFWLEILATLLFGTFPHLISVLQLHRYTQPAYCTTVNLGAIIFMGISDWICEPTQTTIVRWEVIGYIMLSVSCVLLSVTFYDRKRISKV